MLIHIRHWVIGPPLPTRELEGQSLSKLRALAAFSPDALSSIAYANQEIYLALVLAGSAGLNLTLPVGLAITSLLVLVAISYLQTVHAYPSGGGSYAVTRANLGELPGLLAAAALLIDYLLTAAVSLTAAVAAIASAFPVLWPYRVTVALLFLFIITIANLRGAKESGTVMAVPVYLFIGSYLGMLGYGLIRLLFMPGETPPIAPPQAVAPLTTALILRAFAAGCTALTGVEAISNGVPAFVPPKSRNAAQTLLAMALLMGLLFAGSIALTQAFSVVSGPEETILSALARRIVGSGVVHWFIQIATMLILAVAANTSFAGFPRLAAVLAEDGFVPQQFRQLGDRLVYANAIVALSLAAALLIVAFGGDTHALIPLFAVGVFMAFTLSQTGMVLHWWHERGANWWLKAVLNGMGAAATAVTLVVVGMSKFREGAWITILLIPLMVIAFRGIRRHYAAVRAQLAVTDGAMPSTTNARPRVVIPVSGAHRSALEAVAYARSISDDVTAVYVEIEPDSADRVRKAWQLICPEVPLVAVPSPYRSLLGPLFAYLDELDRCCDDSQLATVILPEVVPARWWQAVLHNHASLAIRRALVYRRRTLGFQRTIIEVPYHLDR
ncbi:MAG: APC family permease [Anaerolineae bacterium]|jgi:amino acid transporter|nr:APC family permease [Anaerolineae bacterium]